MATVTTTEQSMPIRTAVKANGATPQRRDLKTTILHADEELYQKQLAEKGGKEDMWQGGDM
jgi:hypothetical protein